MESSLLKNLQYGGKMDVKHSTWINLAWGHKVISPEEGASKLKSVG